MIHTEYKIKLPTFEGPFDLLFHLIRKAEVDIWSISIAEITEQYLAYLQSMKDLNLEIASEFLVMAATLLRLKSKLLLPRPSTDSEQDEEELFEINTAEELFYRLEEYRLFKELASYLGRREEEQQKIFLRSTGGQKIMVLTGQESVYTIWEGADHLSDIMLRFAQATKTDAYNPAFNAVEDYIIVDKIDYIKTMLGHHKKPLRMDTFMSEHSLWEMIVTFIALLEMARQGNIQLLQEKLFSPIFVKLREVTITKEVQGG
jgi:segregation and condensation protein A